jgi:hypothetical protein
MVPLSVPPNPAQVAQNRLTVILRPSDKGGLNLTAAHHAVASHHFNTRSARNVFHRLAAPTRSIWK